MQDSQYIQHIEHIFEGAEKLKGYWDDCGLDFHIAVVKITNSSKSIKNHIVVSTKHWCRVHYIHSKFSSCDVWKHLFQISDEIGRKFIKSTKGDYVYIHKLNLEQTQSIFDLFKKHFGNKIHRAWELKWDINGSCLPN